MITLSGIKSQLVSYCYMNEEVNLYFGFSNSCRFKAICPSGLVIKFI